MINWPLLSNPANWVVIFAIVVMGVAFVTFAHQLFTEES